MRILVALTLVMSILITFASFGGKEVPKKTERIENVVVLPKPQDKEQVEASQPANEVNKKLIAPEVGAKQGVPLRLSHRDLDDFEHELSGLSDDDLREVMSQVDNQINAKKLIERANSRGGLNQAEIIELDELINRQNAARILLVESGINRLKNQLSKD